MRKLYFVFSLIGCFLATSLHSSYSYLQDKTMRCLDQESLSAIDELIPEIENAKKNITESVKMVDSQLESVDFNYQQWQQVANRFSQLPQEALVQDESSAYNSSLLTPDENKIFFRALKAQRIADRHYAIDNKAMIKEQLRLTFDAYVQQNLIVAGSQQWLLLQSSQGLLFQKYLLNNEWITLSSWIDSLESRKQRSLEFDSSDKETQDIPVTLAPLNTATVEEASELDDILSDSTTKELVAPIEYKVVPVAIKASSIDIEKEKKQKNKEIEQKRIQAKLEVQELQRQKDEVEKKRRESQRQKDLERQAAQQLMKTETVQQVNQKNNLLDNSKSQQKEKARANKQKTAKIKAAKIQAEEEENKLLEEAVKATTIQSAFLVSKKDRFDALNRVVASSKEIEKHVGFSEEDTKVFKRYLNFINFPSIKALTEDVLWKLSGNIFSIITSVHHLVDDLNEKKIDFKSELLKNDPDYFQKLAQIRLNWINVLHSFVSESIDDTTNYEVFAFSVRAKIKKMKPDEMSLYMKQLKNLKIKLDEVNSKIEKVHCIIGAIDSLQDKNRILFTSEQNDLDRRSLALQGLIERMSFDSEQPLSLKGTYKEIHYPELIKFVSHMFSKVFAEGTKDEQLALVNKVINRSYVFFEENQFVSHADCMSYKTKHAEEIKNDTRSAYQDIINSEDELVFLINLENKILDELIMLALKERRQNIASEPKK